MVNNILRNPLTYGLIEPFLGGGALGYAIGNRIGYHQARPTELTGARVDGFMGNTNCIFLPGIDIPSYRIEEKDSDIVGLYKIDAVRTSIEEVKYPAKPATKKTATTIEERLILDPVTPTTSAHGVTIKP